MLCTADFVPCDQGASFIDPRIMDIMWRSLLSYGAMSVLLWTDGRIERRVDKMDRGTDEWTGRSDGQLDGLMDILTNACCDKQFSSEY